MFQISSVLLMVLLFVVAPTNKTSNTLNSKELVQEVDGKQLFMMNCATCHHPTRNSIGPSIYDVKSRWKNKKLLYAYTRNSTEVIKKDAYAKALFEKWNKVVMTPFPKLKDADIEAIFNYVDGEAKKKGLMK